MKTAIENTDVVLGDINKPYNLEELNALSNGDAGFVGGMIGIFIKTTRAGISDMQRALKTGDYNRVAEYAHKIAPPCRHIGADNLLSLIKNIEYDIRERKQVNDIAQLVEKVRQEAEFVIGLLEAEITEKKTYLIGL